MSRGKKAETTMFGTATVCGVICPSKASRVSASTASPRLTSSAGGISAC